GPRSTGCSRFASSSATRSGCTGATRRPRPPGCATLCTRASSGHGPNDVFFLRLHLTMLRKMTRLTTLQFALAALFAPWSTHELTAQSPPIPSPLDAVVAEALHNNIGLASDSQAVVRAEANLREARSRFFPTLSMDARYSELSGVLNLGDFVNP